MIAEPPGDPSAISSFLLPFSNTKVGAIELRGRFPGCTRLAIGPLLSAASAEKSVSSLLSKKPLTICRDPIASSNEDNNTKTKPKATTTDKCDVEGNSGELS